MSTGEPLPITGTPNAWAWLDGKDVATEGAELSIHSHKPPESDALCERNGSDTCHVCLGHVSGTVFMRDGKAYHKGCLQRLSEPNVSSSTTRKLEPDPTYQDCWPSERYPSDGPEDRTPECDRTAQMTDSVINAVPSHVESCVFGGSPEHRRGGDTWPSPDCAGVQIVRETPTKLPVGAPNEHPARDVSQTVNFPVTGNIAWICVDCGMVYGEHACGVATWHMDTCGVCGRFVEVTEARDFGNRQDDDSISTVTADETTSPADSYVEKCPVCCQPMDYGETIDCDQCEEPIGVESFAVVGGPGGVFVYHVPCYDEVYWGGHDTGGGSHGPNACTRCGFSPCECNGDTEIPDRDPDMEWDGPPLSLAEQLRLYGLRVDGVLDRLRRDLDDQAFRDRIVALGARRLVEGYPTFGDAMYHWPARRRGQEGDEEVADRAVYGTSGPIE